MRYIILGLLSVFLHNVYAEERIVSFQSDIYIHKDATLSVKETIQVIGEGRSIRHGIVREFPTKYNDRLGTQYLVKFSIKKVLLDNKEVPFHIANASNGKRVYIGDKDIYLSPGRYSFVIEYETNRQLGFFEKFDELYWNVTGNGWRLPIDHASATIHLPEQVPAGQAHIEGYTGYQGSKNQDYTTSITDGIVSIKTTKPLRQKQGLTVGVTWPPGIVERPTLLQEWQWLFLDNVAWIIALLGILILLVFSFMRWLAFRASQDLGTVIPLFYPPKGMSPGAMRYFIKMRYDNKVLAADLVNMAVQGFITIHYQPNMSWSWGDYRLERKAAPHGQFEEIYQAIDSALFEKGDSITLVEKNRHQVERAIDLVSEEYQKQRKPYFLSIMRYIAITTLINLPFSIGILLAGVFLMGFDVLWIWIWVGFYVIFSLIMVIFILLMRGYTKEGLALKRDIEGFKLFLKTTEEERFAIIGTPPTRTPELYETYLPYAMALGVEKQWSRQFAPLFEKMAQEGHPYTMVWISGGRFDRVGSGSFASSLSSGIGSSISSSSTAPGRSSGSGGRGSSGGGGGGGGGGGW